MCEKKIKLMKLDFFFCVVKYVNLVNYIMVKIFIVDMIVNKKMFFVYFDKYLYMKEINNYVMFFLNVNILFCIINCM